MFKIINVNYENMPQADSIVVLGGGPSVIIDKSYIIDYINKNHSIVIGSNYCYSGLGQLYTYFGDFNRFSALINENNTNNIVVSYNIIKKMKTIKGWIDQNQQLFKTYNFFLFGTRGKPLSDKVKKFKLDRLGRINCLKVAPSGLATVALSSVFRPKKVLICGIDGPIVTHNKKNKNLYKKNYKGRVRVYGTYRKFLFKKNTLKNKVLPLLKRHNIYIEISPSSNFWTINKKRIN